MRRRCQRNSVSGVTSHPARLGRASAAAIAPSKLRSASVSAGRSICRRSTASWWRNTMISRSFERPERTASRASDARNRYKIRYTRIQHRPASRHVNDHGRVFGTHSRQSHQRTHRSSQQPGQTRQTRRLRVHQLHQLQNPGPALRRQTQLGPPRHPHSDLKREEPDSPKPGSPATPAPPQCPHPQEKDRTGRFDTGSPEAETASSTQPSTA